MVVCSLLMHYDTGSSTALLVKMATLILMTWKEVTVTAGSIPAATPITMANISIDDISQ